MWHNFKNISFAKFTYNEYLSIISLRPDELKLHMKKFLHAASELVTDIIDKSLGTGGRLLLQ